MSAYSRCRFFSSSTLPVSYTHLAAVGGRGKPNAIGTFVGAALIGVVENGLYALAFPYYAINVVKGLILLLALVMSNYANKEN